MIIKESSMEHIQMPVIGEIWWCRGSLQECISGDWKRGYKFRNLKSNEITKKHTEQIHIGNSTRKATLGEIVKYRNGK